MSEKTFAIVDIETTGGMVKRDKMTEIAIVLSDGHKIIDEYSTLINPGRSIPPFITKITGIDDSMVADAPFFHEVARDIVEWTDNNIFVAHNVRFDYGFLRAAFADLGFAYNRRRMCTVQMAKRLLDLPSHSLESLINHYKIKVNHRHRALDDARATAVVLHHMLTLEGSARQINHQITRGIRESLLPTGITIDHLHQLPEDPGIYMFRDADGEIVYIGKSKNIQKRVMSHFTKTTRKAELLQKKIASIDHLLTGTDLLAQIIEAQEIRNIGPEMNKAQRSTKYSSYIKTSVNELGYRRFDIVKQADEQAQILNAYSSPRAAKAVLNMLVHEYGLCPMYSGLEVGMGPCSNHQFQTCFGACIHEEDPEDYNERADLASQHINNRFEADFLIVGEGRTPAEKSLIAVFDGQYYGHAYIDDANAIESANDILECVKPQPFYPELNSMIRHQIERGKVEVIQIRPEESL